MATAPVFLPELAESHRRTVEAAGFLRLVPCPRCDSRRRALLESGDTLLGRCLGCGLSLRAPLGIERGNTSPS